MPRALGSMQLSLDKPGHMKAVGINGGLTAADGAMISGPVIALPSTAGNAVLQFDVAFMGLQAGSNPPRTESLIFTVSTDGGATWSDVSFVAPLSSPFSNAWETRSLPMGAYAGQGNLKFGFRYNNEGGVLIGAALDNIRLIDGADGSVIMAYAGDHPDPSTGTGYQLSGSAATLTGKVRNLGNTTFNGYYIRYRTGDGPLQSSALITTPLAPMATAEFPAGLTVTIPADGHYTIKTWLELAGDADRSNDTALATTVGVPVLPAKRPVFEEGTGTWCGWCPRGAVFMDHFAAAHPEGAAAQIAVHNNDPMTISAYDSYMAGYVNGVPNLLVDRAMPQDPLNIDSIFSVAANNFGFADITLGTPRFTGNQVSVPVTLSPAVAITHPKLALVITESNVDGSLYDWYQNNYYSGGGSGPMGGWENEESHVPNVFYHFVARSITPAPGGGAVSLPPDLHPGMVYNADLTATLDSTWKRDNLQYIVVLINGDNAAVMNSAFTPLPSLIPSLQNTTTVRSPGKDIEQLVLYPNPSAGKSYLAIQAAEAGKATWSVTDVTGRKIYGGTSQLQAGGNKIGIDTSHLPAGSYLVRFATAKTDTTLKLLIVR